MNFSSDITLWYRQDEPQVARIPPPTDPGVADALPRLLWFVLPLSYEICNLL